MSVSVLKCETDLLQATVQLAPSLLAALMDSLARSGMLMSLDIQIVPSAVNHDSDMTLHLITAN